ncbi:M20 metallopeptidase family protein [Sphingobacterium pedocola]|uniref:Amidohydrolase n=1 Tax=Sphingobacterium pedocola TaxID=2082722 RepID=A0ABR9T1V0_9SPHI|nr:M20 family metallopeptidase [Sphingobacterium pedocola]MBE8719293.1 amidohydrolase [Sphingobacterium pedocola]
MDLKLLLRKSVEKEFERVVKIRRFLHQYPELSFQEYQTSAFIKSELDALGIPYMSIATTGIFAWIDGMKGVPGDTVVLRADMDALPIQEMNDVNYRSVHDGIMHACGHDFHTANLLGVAAVLKSAALAFSGRVVLLFQPAEERIPGGAQEVLQARVFEEYAPRIKAVLGLHVSPRLDTGNVGICSGRFMASSDEFYIRIKGKGGHAAEPHQAVDPVYIGAQLLSSLQQIISRRSDPSIPSVLTFGRFIGDGAANIIPDEVLIEGTFRTMEEEWRQRALRQITRMIREIPSAFGAEVQLEVRHGYPFLYNDPKLAVRCKRLFEEILGNDVVNEIGLWMAAEDFAYYSHQYPALFFLIGIRNEMKKKQSGLHNAHFEVDEDAFKHAMLSMAYAAINILDKGN